MDVIFAIFAAIHRSIKFALMQKKTDAAAGETRNSALLCFACFALLKKLNTSSSCLLRVFHFFFQGLQGIGLWHPIVAFTLKVKICFAHMIYNLKASDLQVGIVEAEHFSVDKEESVVADEETADPQNELSFKEEVVVSGTEIQLNSQPVRSLSCGRRR